MLNVGAMDAGDWISVVAALAAVAGWVVAARSAKAAQDSAAVALAQLELMRAQHQAQVDAAEQAEIPKVHMFVREEMTGSVVILQNTGTAPLAIDGVLLDGERYAWIQQRQPSDGLKARGVLGALEETLLLHAIGEGGEYLDGLLHPSESTRTLELHLRQVLTGSRWRIPGEITVVKTGLIYIGVGEVTRREEVNPLPS